jgi:hypothetical protein
MSLSRIEPQSRRQSSRVGRDRPAVSHACPEFIEVVEPYSIRFIPRKINSAYGLP